MVQIEKLNLSLGNKKDCSIKKRALATAISVALGGATGALMAALPNGTLLNFDAGTPVVTGCTAGAFDPINGTCEYGTGVEKTDMGGSFFSMDTNGDGTVQPVEKVAISMFAPLNIGSVQESSGQHTGSPDGSESPAIDNPWNFNGNTGMHTLATPISVLSDGGATQLLDLTGWGVNWGDNGPGGIAPTIPMGGQTPIVCAVDCSDNDAYTLDMAVHVPAAFTSVPYTIHLEGTISLPGAPPVLNDDPGHKTIVGNPLPVDVLANDTSADGFDLASEAVSTAPTSGDAVPNADGTITYTPTVPGFTGTDTFEYTINSNLGTPPSGPALVTVQVATNDTPAAVNDTLAVSTAVLDTTPQVVSVLANDTDTNNAPDLPGGIDPASVTVIDQPATGACTADNDPASLNVGTITYSQTAPVVAANVSCTYQVSDIDSVNPPLTSNVATLAIEVTSSTSDWPVGLDSDIIPMLFFEPGVAGDPIDSSVPAKSGSYFTMQVTPDTLIYTMEIPGPDAAFLIGHEQPAGNSHTGAPTGDEETSADLGWSFFSNTGFTFTANGGLIGNSDGTIQFGGDPAVNGGQGRYLITWSGIPEIDLGGDPTGKFTEDLGFGFITCTPAPCENQSAFELEYAAHVPPGDPSGFGGVPYTLTLTGTVGFLDGKLTTSNGTVDSESRSNSSQVSATDPDPDVELQCVGDCFDYTITGVTDSRVFIVFPLAGGVPVNPVWRIRDDNGIWRSFDTIAGDTIQSAPYVPGNVTCPDPADPQWGDLTTGHYCIKLSIADNGLNDLDPTFGIISDPSGMGSGGTAGGGNVFEDTRGNDTSGCSIASTSIISPLRRSEWWLLAGFVAWLGWNRRKHQQR